MATKDKKTSLKPKESASKTKAGQKAGTQQRGKASGASSAKRMEDEDDTKGHKLPYTLDDDE
jgi:hypothetical protein